MTEIIDRNLPGMNSVPVLTDSYVLESVLLSTRSADAYKSFDKRRGTGVCLWMLRHALAPDSEAARRFLVRTQAIARLEPPLCDVLDCGVDSAGMAFAILPALDGRPLAQLGSDVVETERRFMNCLRLIDTIHSQGMVCGDICNASFWLEGSGELRFIGIMGSFDAEAVDTATLPPMETLPFIAPEQRSGAGVEPASDVFALGVLGYYLLTGSYPFGQDQASFGENLDVKNIKPISDYMNIPPVWANEVLMKCLALDPSARYPTAGAALKAIAQVRERATSQESAPVRLTRSQAFKQSASTGPLVSGTGSTRRAVASAPSAAPIPGVVKVGLAVVGVLVISILLTLVFGGSSGSGPNRLEQEVGSQAVAAGDRGMQQAIGAIAKSNVEVKQKNQEFEKLVNSDDPLAHSVLVKSATETDSPELRELAENAIIDRARRLGLMRSSEQVRQWLRTVKEGTRPTSYEAILKSLDTTLPPEAQEKTLREAYATSARLAVKLAAALALDTNKLDVYQPVLAQLVGDMMRLKDANKHSSLALILLNPELALVFSDDVVQRRDELPEADVIPVLTALGDRNDNNVRPIANLAVEKKLVSPIRALFLSTIRDRDLPAEVMNSMIRAAAGVLKPDEMVNFGRWDDREAEKIVLAVCADTRDPEVAREAFDILSGKSLTIEISRTLVEWVRKDHWDQRQEFVPAIGVLGLIELAGPDDMERALAILAPYFKESRVVSWLIETNSAPLLKILMDKYPNALGFGGLLKLLDHSDRELRIKTIKVLGAMDLKDVMALNLIIERYEKERDAEIKQLYRDTFWVLKQRGL